ncbi:MAG: LON peptidase substrate-binding domain-containing protein, partial [Gluconobacter sp.]|uniref:LON peptidase substrate-binding domain-containing protein n=1 Tax=Gluconobacter sp. TaxID=1876758 RepID=UPI0039E755E5
MTDDTKPKTRRRTKKVDDAAVVEKKPARKPRAKAAAPVEAVPEVAPAPRPDVMAVLPLRNIVVFPHMIVPLFVGREKSVKALETVTRDSKQILLVAQKDVSQDDPSADDIYRYGTVSTILQLLKLPDGTVKVLVEGTRRVQITRLFDVDGHFEAEVKEIAEEPLSATPGSDLEALGRSTVSQFEQYIKLNKKIPPEVMVSINQIEDLSKLADT